MTKALTQARKELDKQTRRLLNIHKTSADLSEQIIRLNPQTQHANNAALAELTKTSAAEIRELAAEIERLSKVLEDIIDLLTHPRNILL